MKKTCILYSWLFVSLAYALPPTEEEIAEKRHNLESAQWNATCCDSCGRLTQVTTGLIAQNMELIQPDYANPVSKTVVFFCGLITAHALCYPLRDQSRAEILKIQADLDGYNRNQQAQAQEEHPRVPASIIMGSTISLRHR